MSKTLRLSALAAVSSLFALIACGSSGDGDGNGSTGDLDNGELPGGSSSGSFGGSSGGSSSSSGGTQCVNLECKQVACPNGGTTSLSGKVYLPEGTIPLYNAIVYIPNSNIEPFKPGVVCDKCGTALSGNPITTALTDAKGSFVLKNVPVGVDFPLVVQIGRWRRQVTIPAIQTACTDTPVAAASTRLPRTKAEGDIPHIAMATGGADSLECFLRKLGIADSEITNQSGAGRVHLFQGLRTGADGARIDGSTTSAQSLWDDADALKTYDMVILSCEGNENNGTKSTTSRDNLAAYLDAGGRVFASHFHYTWFKNGSGQLPSTASWVGNSSVGNGTMGVDTSSAKGQSFRDWLVEVGASTTPGQVPATELRRNVTTAPASGMPVDTSRRWLYLPNGGAEDTKFYSFNTPVGTAPENQCGRGVYTDVHVSSGDGSGGTFPANCTTTGLTPQEKALLFLLMDLAACIQDDSKPPQPPPAGGGGVK